MTRFKKILSLCACTLTLALTLITPSHLVADEPLSPDQKKAVEALIHDYITNNPEVVGDAIRALTEKQRLAEAKLIKQRIIEKRDEIFGGADSLVGGNPDGDITLVEFFDYNCPYCKKGHADLLKMVADDGNIRVVYKEYPILGPDSVLAAKAALAAGKQGKYLQFNEKLLTLKGRANDFTIEEIAQSIGLDIPMMEQDMKDPAFDQILLKTRKLAASLGISGTPAFLVGDELIPGFVDASELKKVITAARKEKG